MAKDRVYDFQGDRYGHYILESINPAFSPAKEELRSKLPGDAKLNTELINAYEGPQYEDKYGGKVDSLMSALESQNRNGFQYDYNTDPAYQAYRKQYLREGQRATQDTMAAAAAMTGGRPSSYAATAAAQAGNNYAAQLSDKVPELYQNAYNRYLQQYQQQAQILNAYQQQQQTDYNRFSQDRQFGYNANQDWINNMRNNRRDTYDMMNADRAFNYQQRQDWIKNMQTQEQWEWNAFMQQAQMALNVGDIKQLEAMGFDTSRANFGNELTIAQLIAQYTGDTSGLRALLKR